MGYLFNPRLRHHLGERVLRQFRYCAFHFAAVSEVAGERDHMAARARHPRLGADRGIPAALGQQQNPQPGRRAERRCQRGGVGGGEVGDCRDAQPAKLFGGLRAHSPQRIDLAVTHHGHPVGVGQLVDSGGLGQPGGDLGALFVVADAH